MRRPRGYCDYDRNWLSESVMPPFHNIKFSADPPILEIGERGKFLILLEDVDASRSDEGRDGSWQGTCHQSGCG